MDVKSALMNNTNTSTLQSLSKVFDLADNLINRMDKLESEFNNLRQIRAIVRQIQASRRRVRQSRTRRSRATLRQNLSQSPSLTQVKQIQILVIYHQVSNEE
jgi:uncharacterized protein YoxC